VSYDLEATHFGAEDRCDCFTFDPTLPDDLPRYTTADYTGAGEAAGYGIDRGHLARSFDRTSASLDNATTFYFTNIVPQAADNNQGPWAALETYLGDLARLQNREVYIIAGVAGSKGTVKNEGRITIPASLWKVAVIMPRDQGLADIDDASDLEVIAVVMPNEPGVRNVSWETYRTSVDEVERVSGYDLLALLPDPIEAVVESGPNVAPAIAAFRLDPATGPFRVSEKACAGRYTACVRFSVTDPNGAADGPFATTLDWGDGTPWTPNQVPAATPLVAPHDYAAPGVYQVRVTVTDRRGASSAATLTLRVEP
jgi:endonuclease G